MNRFTQTLLLLLLAQLVLGQMIPVNNGDGTVSYTSSYPNSNLHFYLFGDGYYTKQKSPLNGYEANATGYDYRFYTVGNKDTDPPLLTTDGTGSITTTAPISTFPSLNMDPLVDHDISWNLTDFAQTYIIIKFEGGSESKGGGAPIGCLEFEYDGTQLDVDVAATLIYNDWIDSSEVINSNKIKFHYSGLGTGDRRAIYVPVIATAPLNTPITYSTTKKGYCSAFEKKVTTTQIVSRYPHDPNYINNIFPQSLTSTAELLNHYSETSQFIRYKFQFHNSGEAPAINVAVNNRLGNNLFGANNEFDISSLVVLESSHPVVLDFSGSGSGSTTSAGDVIFNFNNINLSGLNEPGQSIPFDQTIGWLIYEICLDDFIDVNSIDAQCAFNDIDIHFDDQDPIPASNMICYQNADSENPCSLKAKGGNGDLIRSSNTAQPIDFKLSPNPVYEELSIDFAEMESLRTVSIFDFSGKLVKSVAPKDIHNPIDLQNLVSGFYIIQLTTDTDKFAKEFVKI